MTCVYNVKKVNGCGPWQVKVSGFVVFQEELSLTFKTPCDHCSISAMTFMLGSLFSSLSPLTFFLFLFTSLCLSPAMQQVLDNLGELPTSTGAKDIDLLFLRGIMESPTVSSHTRTHILWLE